MTVEEQHIDFKRKLNKVDSANNVNFEVPYIDEYLNEAQEIFIKRRLQRNNIYSSGFEANQKRTEDLKDIVVKYGKDYTYLTPQKLSDTLYEVTIPEDYLYYIRANVKCSKGDCLSELSCIFQQHDDLNNVIDSAFYSPSFEWGETPIVFSKSQIFIYTDGTFEPTEFLLDYLRRPRRIANPDAYIDEFGDSGYLLPIKDSSGNYIPAVQQNCELSSMFVCREIVDIAVELAHMDLGDPKFQLSSYKNKIYNE
jgi:hypothetical protein